MFSGSIGQEHASTGRNLEGARRVLIGADRAQESESDPGAREGARIVVAVYLASVPGGGEKLVAMNAESLAAGELSENELSSRRPAPVRQELPIAAPDPEL